MFIRDAWQIKYNNSNNLWNKDLENSITKIFDGFQISNFKNILKEIDIAWFSLKKSANVRLIMEGFFISLSEEKQFI